MFFIFVKEIKTKKMKARYIRVSTINQNEARQLAKANPNELVMIDKCSGAIPFEEREQGQKLIELIENKEVTEVVVSSIDRLGRNSFDIQSTINYLNINNINLFVENIGLNSFVEGKQNPIFKMICDVLANVSEMERNAIRERTMQGIELAKAKGGVYKGRLKGSTESNEEFLSKYKNAVKVVQSKGNLSLRDLAKLGECSPNTIKKIKSILKEQATI